MLLSFLSDRRGLSAVEFALIAPLLLLFWVGTVELDSALTVNRRVTQTASTIADLTAQDDLVNQAEINAIFTAARAIMAPYDSGDTIRMTISSVGLNAQNQPAVRWSAGYNRAGRGAGSTVTMPSNLVEGGSTVILAEIEYPYVPPMARFLAGGVTMRETFYLRPRRTNAVCWQNANNTTVC